MTVPTLAPPTRDGRARDGAARSTSVQAVARHRGRVAAGVALLVVSAVLAVLVYGNLGDRVPVLAAAEDIEPGAVIAESDLKVVRVAADADVATIASSRRSEVVGRRAAVGIPAGSILTSASVTDGPTVPPGSVLIGAVVKAGQYPLGLQEGDVVLVYATGDGATSTDGVEAVITSISSRSAPDGTAISLAVPADDAPELARAGADGRLLLTQPVR